MIISLCNEVLRELDFAAQCALAKGLGYDGLEVAPFTLSDAPDRLPAARRAELRRIAQDHGLAITGLHYLLLAPDGLSITSPDEAVRKRTTQVMRALIELCADLGGTVPGARLAQAASDRARPARARRTRLRQGVLRGDRARCRAGRRDLLHRAARPARGGADQHGRGGGPDRRRDRVAGRAYHDRHLRRRAQRAHADPQADRTLAAQRQGRAHSPERPQSPRPPGQGDLRFGPVLAALEAQRYAGICSVEPFVYEPDGPTCAARAIGYLRGLREGMTAR
jgi:D-psicose/D-tagatose/L-ribulose 3-epimerase